MSNNLRVLDQVKAEALGVGSALHGQFVQMGDVRFDNKYPTHEPFRWRHARMSADSISDWVEFEGNKDSGWLPSEYLEAGILEIDRNRMNDVLCVHGGREAVAYKLGSTVMVGHSDKSPLFSRDPENSRNRQVAMCIGKETLAATVGVWTYRNEFISAPAIVTKGNRIPTRQVPTWVTLVERMLA